MKRKENFTIAEILKTIRKANNLTQEKFAKIFFVTKNTISHYENGTRIPNINFLLEVCNYFDLPLTYFQKGFFWQKKHYANLLICKNQITNKLGLYDIASDKFILHYEYDNILLSTTGYHIASKNIDKKIKYIVFDYNGKKCLNINNNYTLGEFAFNDYGTVIAKVNNSGNFCLLDFNGTQISKEYSKILPFSIDYKMKDYSNFICYDYKNQTTTLINFNGEIIKTFAKIIDINFKYINTIKEVQENLEKYGSSMFCFIDEKIFENANNYPIIIESIDNHISQILKTLKPFDENSTAIFIKESLVVIINLIWKAQKYKPYNNNNLLVNIKEKEFLNLNSKTNKITTLQHKILKYKTELYKLIGLL